MDMTRILGGYEKRVNVIGSYFLISSIVNNRKKFQEFSNVEFYNLLIQILCFIFERSLRRKRCFKENIKSFIEEVNILAYKKPLTNDYLDELTKFTIKHLTNKGKTFAFPYYNNEKEDITNGYIKIIEDTDVIVNKENRITYSLTPEGYRLLLSTKEIDELYQIKISQTLAQIRLKNDDYEGAKEDIYDIINNLEIQYQKIDGFMKIIRNNIFNTSEVKYSDIIDQTLSVLLEEMDKYEELRESTLLKIKDKEDYLDGLGENLHEKAKVLRTQLIQLKDLIIGIGLAKSAASGLISRVQIFREEYSDILEKLLRMPVLKRFNFKEEILNKLEDNPEFLIPLRDIYTPLFKINLPNIFTINIPYLEQTPLKKEINKEDIIQDSHDFNIVSNEEKKKRIEDCQNYYYSFVNILFNYAELNESFTLKELLNDLLKNDTSSYMEITKDAELMRNVVMFFAYQKEGIKLYKIIKMIHEVTFSSDAEFVFENIVVRLYKDEHKYVRRIESMISDKIIDDEMEINTEINLEEMTATKLELTNVKFKFIEL
ncbi:MULTISPECIES: hypothetical protein [Clostridium]|uniref:hypothetical protein n=1 Tax=Clostridium TaxID=1485 RepID=UPI00132FE9AB|nr:hypothetical protein [Clostridium sp.]